MFGYLLFIAQLNAATIADWASCTVSDVCGTAAFRCCVAPENLDSGKTTCRPASSCATSSTVPSSPNPIPTTGIADWATCTGNEVCQTVAFRCCVPPENVISGKASCRPTTQCAALQPAPGPSIPEAQRVEMDAKTKVYQNWMTSQVLRITAMLHPIISIPLKQFSDLFYGAKMGSTGTSWAGTNHYFLHTLPEADQDEIIQGLKFANIKVVRLFVSAIKQGAKGTNNIQTFDLEPVQVGIFDDQVLRKLDLLLPKLEAAGIKAIVAFHDRYMLGAWGIDSYVKLI
jgi:hypothetical protein